MHIYIYFKKIKATKKRETKSISEIFFHFKENFTISKTKSDPNYLKTTF